LGLSQREHESEEIFNRTQVSADAADHLSARAAVYLGHVCSNVCSRYNGAAYVVYKACNCIADAVMRMHASCIAERLYVTTCTSRGSRDSANQRAYLETRKRM
jgi:hypothetical protein